MIAFWSKHKIGILATVIFHVAIILYFNTSKLELPKREVRNKVLLELDYTEEEIPEDEELTEEETTETPTEESIEEKIQNMMRDAQDRRKMSSQNFSEKEIEQQLEEKYKQLEQDIIKQRQEEGKGFDASKYEIKKNTEPTQNSNTQPAENKVAGRVTTECSIKGRNCYAKTPSYRCPSGGKIHIDIKVNQKGRVTHAEYNASKSTSSNECLVNEAIKYAKLSKANQDFNAPNTQSGYIIYNFISQ